MNVGYNNSIRIILFCIFFLYSLNVFSIHALNDEIFKSQVHSLEQFIERINGREIYPLVKDEESDKIKITRFSLFNMDLTSELVSRDSIMRLEIELVDALDSIRVPITMSDTQNWLEVECDFEYYDKNYPIVICMRLEEFRPYMWRWAIFDVKNVDSIGLLTNKNPIPIDPVEHELNFLTLSDLFEDNQSEIWRTVSVSKEVDAMSFFMGLIAAGRIKLNHCNKVIFMIGQIPGWKIKVNQINRNSSNSGWLINEITKEEI